MGTSGAGAEDDDVVIDLTVGALLEPRDDTPELVELRPPANPGVPGASARREFERRRTGATGSIATILSDDVSATPGRSAAGTAPERVAAVLSERLDGRAVLLHDRSVARTRGTADLLVVAATGVWVIGVEPCAGAVEHREVGGFFRTEQRLHVGGRDRTRAVDGLTWQHGAVVGALADDRVPVQAALCCTGTRCTPPAEPFLVDEVWITSPATLADLVGDPGPLGPGDVDRVARHLAAVLPAR